MQFIDFQTEIVSYAWFRPGRRRDPGCFNHLGGFFEMKRFLMSLTMLIAVSSVSVLGVAAATAKAPMPAAPPLSIIGTIANAGGTFAGTLNITRFAVQNGNLVAIGNLTGTLLDPLGNVIGTITNQLISLLVTPGTASCEILDLQLGPLDLNLLGLMVHLDQVNLNITAQQGSGNLLGNLLCAVAHLLDGGGPLSGLAGLLNNILRLL